MLQRGDGTKKAQRYRLLCEGAKATSLEEGVAVLGNYSRLAARPGRAGKPWARVMKSMMY